MAALLKVEHRLRNLRQERIVDLEEIAGLRCRAVGDLDLRMGRDGDDVVLLEGEMLAVDVRFARAFDDMEHR